MSGRMTATLPLPAAASGFSAAIARRVRSNWATEIDTVAADDELAGLLLLPLEAEDEELLLQAAAARHAASDADAQQPLSWPFGII